MTELRKAAEMVLKAWDKWKGGPFEREMEFLRQALAQQDKMRVEGSGSLTTKPYPDRYQSEQEFKRSIAQPEQEPVGYVTDSGASAYFCKGVELDDDTPLYAAPPHYWGNVTSAELVEELRRRDMLMVPVKEQEPYDQTALELCEKCGWKAIISDEGCLVCARNEQEPFIYVREDNERPFGGYEHCSEAEAGAFPVYTAPPKREWVGLTADEIWKCNKAKAGSAVEFHICSAHQNVMDFAEAIEAKLKEKNT